MLRHVPEPMLGTGPGNAVSSSRVRIMDRREDGLQPQTPQTGRLIHARVAILRDSACFRAVFGRLERRSVENVVFGHLDLA